MPEERGVLRGISWRDCCSWCILLRTFRLAVSVPFLLLATMGVLATSAGWQIAENLFYSDSDANEVPQFSRAFDDVRDWPGAKSLPASSLSPDVAGSDRPSVAVALARNNPMLHVAYRMVAPFGKLFNPALDLRGFAYCLMVGLWTLLMWAFFGAAITRMAAVQLACDERVGIKKAITHAQQKLAAYFTAPLLPMIGVGLIVIPMLILGWVMRIPAGVGMLMGGLLWIFVLSGASVMAVLLLGLLFGWPLMWATIGTEDGDAFDAFARSFAYTFQRPLHYLFYVAVASVLGVLGWLLVQLFSEAVITLGQWGVSWGAGSAIITSAVAPDEAASGLLRVGSGLVAFWVGCVRAVATAFAYSYFWTAIAAIYLLLRHDVDQTEMDEVSLEEEESYGLPPLASDAAGVPGVADEKGDSQTRPTGDDAPPEEVSGDSDAAGPPSDNDTSDQP